jgi:hypothetical protein
MRLFKLAAIATGVLLVVLLAWYFLSPFIFLLELTNAAKEGDRTTLAVDVDFPSVRQGLDKQLDDLLALRAQHRRSHRRDSIADLVEAFLPALGHRVIDVLVTPEGVAAILREHVSQPGDGSRHPSLWRGNFRWLDRNHLQATYANIRQPAHPASLILERRGLFSWRLARLNLPLNEVGGAGS